jgi:hypothetical protein
VEQRREGPRSPSLARTGFDDQAAIAFATVGKSPPRPARPRPAPTA